jgi:hypothetical protein
MFHTITLENDENIKQNYTNLDLTTLRSHKVTLKNNETIANIHNKIKHEKNHFRNWNCEGSIELH